MEKKLPSLMKEGQTTIPPLVCEEELTMVLGFGPNCRREPRASAAPGQEAEFSGSIFQLYEPFLIPAKPEACTWEGRVAEMHVTVQSSDELDEEARRPLVRSRMLKWQVREGWITINHTVVRVLIFSLSKSKRPTQGDTEEL